MNFKIVTVPHTAFAAGILVDQLIKLGYSAKIVDHVDIRDPDIYIIYNAAGLTRLPKQYIIQQTEISTSHWFTSRYLKTLRNAMAVWDYAEPNTTRYKRLTNKISIVTPGYKKVEHNGKDIDYLFYGWIEGSKRRSRILNNIRKEKDVTVIENTLGQTMWDILKRAKVVINIHYYDDSPLELYRINEAISHGCRVWLQDEGKEVITSHDNFDEIREGLKVAGL